MAEYTEIKILDNHKIPRRFRKKEFIFVARSYSLKYDSKYLRVIACSIFKADIAFIDLLLNGFEVPRKNIYCPKMQNTTRA